MIRREVHLYNLHPFDDCYIAQTLEDMYISKALGELDLFDEASLWIYYHGGKEKIMWEIFV